MNTLKTEAPIIRRIRALFESLMTESEVIPATFRPVARNLVENYIRKADPEQVRAIIVRIQVEIIPWLLREDDNH